LAITAADVIAYARAATDHDSDTQVTDAGLIVLLGPVWQRIRRRLVQRVPTLYTKVAATFTVSSGNTQDVTGAPLSLTDYDRVRRIRRLVNSTTPTNYVPIGVADAIDPERVPVDQDVVFLERGTVLEFYPASIIPTMTFELSYLTKAATLTGGGSPVGASDAIDAPEGIQEILGEELAAKIRPRFEEDPTPHLRAAEAALGEYLWDLQRRYGVHPDGMRMDGQ
jgi:hypothetical protein